MGLVNPPPPFLLADPCKAYDTLNVSAMLPAKPKDCKPASAGLTADKRFQNRIDSKDG